MPSSGTPESWEEIAILFLWVQLSCLVMQVSCFIAADYQFCSCLKPNRKTWNQPLTILKFSWTPTCIYSGGWGMWGLEDTLSETVGFKNWTLIAKLVSKHPYHLNHLTGPQLTVCNLADLVSSYITQLQNKFITLKGDSIPLSHHSLSPWPHLSKSVICFCWHGFWYTWTHMPCDFVCLDSLTHHTHPCPRY